MPAGRGAGHEKEIAATSVEVFAEPELNIGTFVRPGDRPDTLGPLLRSFWS